MKQSPIPANEVERLRALSDYEILDSLPEKDFDRITQLASIICETPISLISLVDERRQWFKSSVGLDVRETPRELAFCQYAIMDKDIYEVADATRNELFKDNLLVTSAPDIRFYAGYPLIDPQGNALGTLCVIDRKPKQLTIEQKKALSLLGQEAISLILERRQKHELRNFEKLFQLSSDLVFIGGTDGYFRKINPAFTKVFGWSEEHLLNTNTFEFYHPDDIANTENELQRQADGENTVNFKQRFKTITGDYKTIEWTSMPEPSTGKIFGIGRDVTEILLKDQQLADSEEKLRVFFENSQGLMCTHDLQDKFLSVNNAGASILGYTVEELLELSLYDIIPPERYPFAKAYLAEIKNKGVCKGQMYTVDKSGALKTWMYNNVLEISVIGQEYVIGNAIDITEKELLQKDLKQTQEILEQTNRVARVGGWNWDIKSQTVSWTSITRLIHDVAPDFEPDLHSSINFYKEGESRTKITDAVNQALIDGTPYDLELQVINAKGEEIWVRSIGEAEFEDGECKRLFGTFQDIDKSKKAELEITRSRKLLDDVLNAASETSIIATDADGLITVFNAGAEKLLGYSADEMIGKQTPVMLHSADEIKKRGEELGEEYNEQIEGFNVITKIPALHGLERRQWTYIKKDGSTCIVSHVETAIKNIDGEIDGYLSVATDITARKQIEHALMTEKARLAAFVEYTPTAIAMADNDMKFIAASRKMLEEYGIAGRNIIGLTPYEVFGDISEDNKATHQQVLKGDVITREEYKVRFPGIDHDKYLNIELRPWYEYDDKIGGMMMSSQDITSLIRQREELKQAKAHADQANSAKSEFLANMSHEIRTPLNGVIGFTDLVLKTQLNQTQHQYLTIVIQSANALLSIINDILDFSKIEAGKLELDVEKSNLYELGAQATDILTYQIQSKGLEMLLNISPDLPTFIWTDSVRLKQIMINLLGNASKFTEKGEIELKIETLSSNGDETTIRFGVRDTGIGIQPDKQGKIFEAFSQEDSSTTKKYGGTGLGLTISNKLLGLMGSKLQLTSKPGEGSFFYFDLTLKTENGDPINWEGIESIKKVLIVDDNENNRLILKQMLLLKNIKATEAKNGFETLQLLSTGEQYDVILMDYHMPYMDGLETVKKIRESFHKTAEEQPVILLHSSSDDEAIMKACDDLKISRRMVKPLKMRNLYDALSTLHVKGGQTPVNENGNGIQSISDLINILIVEDNPVNMLLAKTILKRIAPNAVLHEANDGSHGIIAFQTQTPDLILMDVQMPVMNGYEATRQIRTLETSGRVPIIALTAGNVKSERERCLDAGMDDFIVKPVVEETIAVVINKWLDLKTTETETKPLLGASDSTGHFDLKGLQDMFDNDEEILHEFLALTRKELIQSKLKIKESFEGKKWEELSQLAHKLRGTALAADLQELAKISGKLEKGGETQLEELVDAMAIEVELVLGLMG